jgi:hypothetical protein
MGRFKLKIWLLLLGWLWLQPALAQHPLEASLPDHGHHCLICALHLDGKLALTPTPLAPAPQFSTFPPVIPGFPLLGNPASPHYSIRAPPASHR